MRPSDRVRSPFVRHVATLLSGRVATQMLSLILAPIIARIFDPAHFGVAAIFATLSQGLADVAHLRYFRGSLIIEDEHRALTLQAMSAKLLVIGCVLVLGTVAIAGPSGIHIGFLAPLGPWVWLLPVGILLHGMGQILSTVHTRRRTFRPVAVADVGQSLVMGGSRILFGLGGSSIWGLVAGYLIGSAARVMLLARRSLRPMLLLRTRIRWQDAKELASEYRDFPLYNMPAGLMTFLAGKLPILVMGMMFAPTAVGLYAMGERLIRMPVINAGNAIREVFLRKLAVDADRGTGVRRSLALLTSGMLLLGILPFGLLGFFGADILTFFLGERWADAGIYVQILAPWYYAVWVTTGVQPTLVMLRRQRTWLWNQIVGLVVRLSVFVAAYLWGADVMTTLMWFSIVNVLAALTILAFTFFLISTTEGPNQGSGRAAAISD